MTTPTNGLPAGVTHAMLGDVRGTDVAPDLAARIKARVLARISAQQAGTEAQGGQTLGQAADARVAKASPGETRPGFVDILAGEGWCAFGPGVEAKILFDDGITRSWMVRMQAGSNLPAHGHDIGAEECLVLEGEVWLGDQLYGPGDYQLAKQGTWHGNVRSDRGCVMFVRSQVAAAHGP